MEHVEQATAAPGEVREPTAWLFERYYGPANEPIVMTPGEFAEVVVAVHQATGWTKFNGAPLTLFGRTIVIATDG